MERKEYTQDEWTHIHVRIPKEFFTKNTEKAHCFKLWGKKFVAFPMKLTRDFRFVDDEITCTIPKWYIKEHKLKSIVEDFDKHHFPTQKEQAEQAQQMIDFTAPVAPERMASLAPTAKNEEQGKAIPLDEYGPIEW